MTGEEKLQTTCVLRLFGVSALRVQQAAAGFPAAWQVQAQCRSRGAETLLALDAGTASGLKKAQQSLQACFSAALYGTGSTSLSQAAVQALEQHHKLLVCSDAASGTLLETRLEAVPGAEKVFDFGRMSYADAKTNALLEAQVQRRTRSDHAADRTLARVQAAQRLVGVEFAAGCLKQSNARFLLVLGTRKGCWLRTVYAADAPALWLLDMIRRAACGLPQAEGTLWQRYRSRRAFSTRPLLLWSPPRLLHQNRAKSTGSVMPCWCSCCWLPWWQRRAGGTPAATLPPCPSCCILFAPIPCPTPEQN